MLVATSHFSLFLAFMSTTSSPSWIITVGAIAASAVVSAVITRKYCNRSKSTAVSELGFDPAEVSRLIRTRRSIFASDYCDKPVSREVIDEMLENANWAPTHGKTEPWRFQVMSGDALVRLGEFLCEEYQTKTPKKKFETRKYEKKRTSPPKASYVIAIIMTRNPNGKIPEREEVEAVACAVQNMHLTATAHGVAAYWSTSCVYGETFRKFLGLGENEVCLGCFYVARTDKKWPKGNRGAVEDKVKWVEH